MTKAEREIKHLERKLADEILHHYRNGENMVYFASLTEDDRTLTYLIGKLDKLRREGEAS